MESQAQIDKTVAVDLKIILDELLSNALQYGSGSASSSAEVVLTTQGGGVEVEITNDGIAFDPTTYRPEPLTTETASERTGALGLLFVRNLVTDWHYSRQGGLNRLVIRRMA